MSSVISRPNNLEDKITNWSSFTVGVVQFTHANINVIHLRHLILFHTKILKILMIIVFQIR